MIRWAHLLILSLAMGLLVAVIIQARSGGPDLAAPDLAAPDPAAVLDPRPLSGAAPAFMLPGRDGKPVSLADFSGSWVLVNFWATWCEPCKDELPHLAALARSLSGSPFKLVLVSVDEDWRAVDRLAADIARAAPDSPHQQAWQRSAAMLRGGYENVANLLDPKAGTPAAYGTSKYPETYLIDPRGMLVHKFIGPKPWGLQPALELIRKRVSGGS